MTLYKFWVQHVGLACRPRQVCEQAVRVYLHCTFVVSSLGERKVGPASPAPSFHPSSPLNSWGRFAFQLNHHFIWMPSLNPQPPAVDPLRTPTWDTTLSLCRRCLFAYLCIYFCGVPSSATRAALLTVVSGCTR